MEEESKLVEEEFKPVKEDKKEEVAEPVEEEKPEAVDKPVEAAAEV